MEKYTTRRELSTYTVNTSLLRELIHFAANGIPRLLNAGSSYHQPIPSLSAATALTIFGSDHSKVWSPATQFAEGSLHNDVQEIALEVTYVDSEIYPHRAIVFELHLGRLQEETTLTIAVQDDKAREKTAAIEDALLQLMAPFSNRNRVTYPNDIVPTLVFIGGFLIGLGGLMLTNLALRFGCTLIFGLAVYYVAHRFIKGYCTFDTGLQKKMNRALSWGSIALALLLVGLLVGSVA